MASKTLLQAVMVTAELTGTELSEAAARVFVADLSGYPEAQVLSALTRCRQECRGRVTLADVIARIDDGRPGVEEAWAMIPKDEQGSVYWTREMQIAFGVCAGLIDEDPIAARMAFKESYQDEVTKARANKSLPKWMPSFGHDVAGRKRAIEEAKEKRRITNESAAKRLALLGGDSPPATTQQLIEYGLDWRLGP